MALTKVCVKCREEKPLDDFYAVSGSNHRGGRKNECKVCWNRLRRERYARRREQELAKNAEWSAANPERHQAARDEWSAANPDADRVYSLTALARRSGVPIIDQVHPLVVLELDDGLCGICGEDVDPMDFQVDHLIPRLKGGEHSYANTQVAHRRCNELKAFALPD